MTSILKRCFLQISFASIIVFIVVVLRMRFYLQHEPQHYEFTASKSNKHIISTFLQNQHLSLSELLQQINSNSESTQYCELILVLGNEACDLDSMVSSLLWAYYKQSQINTKSILYIPVFSISKKELKLRKDAVYLFNKIDSSLINKLFFIDTIPLKTILTYRSSHTTLGFNVHLMDHNALSIQLHPILKDYVTYIIDHHKDERLYLQTCDKESRNIGTAGSNVAFIIHHILMMHKDNDRSLLLLLGSEFGVLINAIILLDTGGFDNDWHKTTDIDRNVFKMFEQYNLNKNYKDWFSELLTLRSNVDGFSFYDLLLKDLKIFEQNDIIFGISELSVSLEYVINMEQHKLFEVVETFKNEKKLDFVVVGSMSEKRELALFCNDGALFHELVDKLESIQNGTYLQLDYFKIENYEDDSYIIASQKIIYYRWWDMNIAISRKQLVPVLQQILTSIGTKI